MAKEDIFYVFVHISATVYALYEFYRFGETQKLQMNGRYTEVGWPILNRRQMKYDLEIGPFISYISKRYYYWLIGHCISFEVVRCINPKKLPLMHAILGISSMYLNASAIVIALIIVSTLSFYLVMRMRKKSFVWYILIVWLSLSGTLKANTSLSSLFGHDLFQFYHGFTMFSSQLLRLTSFALDYCETHANPNENANKIDAKNISHEISQRFSLEKFLGYAFYLPVFVEGPPFNYSHYADAEIIKFKPFMVRIQQLIFGIFRLFAIYLVNELMLHHFYAGAVIADHSYIHSLSGWALFGFIICTGLHFTNAYMMKYGLATVLSKFEGINAPNKPFCFLRIHKYSIMWRCFDAGLYEFLHKYIYTGILRQKKSPNGRKLARFSVFAFVFLWHCPGSQISTVIWVWSNFLVLFLEDVGSRFEKIQLYRGIASFIGTKTVNKLNKLFGSQLLLLSTILSMFYLTNADVAVHILSEIYLVNNNFSAYFIISLVFYCIYRSCEFMFKLTRPNKAKKKHSIE